VGEQAGVGPAAPAWVEELTSLDDLGPLDRYQHRVLGLVRDGLASGAQATDVTGAVADANDALVRRLLTLAEEWLGPPPVAYRWLAMGSHGRREQVLSSDQDHAIAYHPPDGDDHEEIRRYFSSLATRVTDGLARAGLPLCTGGFMATQWCRPIGEYERMFRSWVDDPHPLALLQAEVFLDTRACHGELDTDVLDRILRGGGARGPFRVQLARAAVTFRPPLSWHRSLKTIKTSDGGGLLDVKLGGAAAIVLLARLYSLAAGSAEHSTLPRLAAAVEGGSLGSTTADALVDAYHVLTDLRLRHQIAQVEAGVEADNRVRVDRLTKEDRTRLRDVLRIVRDIQDVTAMRFKTTMAM
jgi:CBS domain-containing protein